MSLLPKFNLSRSVPVTGRTACGDERISPLNRTTTPRLTHKKQNKTRIHNRDWTEHIKDAGSESYVQKGDSESFWGSFLAIEAVFVGKVAKRTGEKLNSLHEKMETTPHVVQNKKNMKRLHHNRVPCVRGLEGH